MLLGSEEEPCMSTLIFVHCSKHTAHTHIRIHMYTYTYIFTSRSAKYPQPAGIKLHLLQLVLGLDFFVYYLSLNTKLSTVLDTNSNVI